MPSELMPAEWPEPALAAMRICRAMVAGLPEPVLVVGIDRHVLIANPPACDLFGAASEGSLVLALIRQPEPAAAVEQGLSRLVAGETAWPAIEARMRVLQSAGEAVYRMLVQRLDPAIGFPAVVVALHDISHIEEAEQQRSDFVANVSHELRSPLTVLAGFIETLQHSARDDPAARDEFLAIMSRETKRMTRLVNDLLSLSKVEANERIRPRATVSLSEAVHATLAALRPQIEDAGIVVRFDDLPDAEPIPGDRDQLVQVFANLLENALKYGASGGRIEIVMTRQPQVTGVVGPALQVAITDHGEGIDPIHVPRLTERFYRVDTDRSRQNGGTGLGLAIVKHIVNRHRGRLTIRSQRGVGSTFTVVLPCT